jgi:hypothetical protein
MNHDLVQQEIINKKILDLRKKREQILSLTPEKRVNAILDAQHPEALIHSFPEEDFYFLIHDTGLDDCLELLSFASSRQWEYVVDMEIWQRDRMDNASSTFWLDLLFKADPDRFIQWFIHEKTEFAEYYLYKNLRIIVREDENDASDFEDDYFTFDDIFYVNILDDPSDAQAELDGESAISMDKISKTFLMNFLKRLSDHDHVLYQQVLHEALSIIPAETEEEAYRLKNFRLAEKGYLPFEEAIGIYQPLSSKDLLKTRNKLMPNVDDKNNTLSSPLYPIKALVENNLFTDSLKTIDSDAIINQLQTEFAGVLNKIIAADQKQIRSRDDLKNIVKKGCGYINIGLEHLTQNRVAERKQGARELIQSHCLDQIFRVGYGLALNLKWRTDKWIKKSWFAKNGFALSFWGEERFGVLGGLLLKRPLFYDNYVSGRLYRDFASEKDVNHTEKLLNEIIEIDALFPAMNITPDRFERFVTYENIILTLWARRYLLLEGNDNAFVSLTLNEFKRFFKYLWHDSKFDGKTPRKTSTKIKEDFLKWMSDQTGKDIDYISSRLGQAMEHIFKKIEQELGSVLSKHLDPKYIHLFIIET